MYIRDLNGCGSTEVQSKQHEEETSVPQKGSNIITSIYIIHGGFGGYEKNGTRKERKRGLQDSRMKPPKMCKYNNGP